MSETTKAILGPPFEWCWVTGGRVVLEDGRPTGGTAGGEFSVTDFAIAKYPITNAQYQVFLDDEAGYVNPQWWYFSEAGVRWRHDRRGPKPTAFGGANLPRTRVSWFDAMAFCAWLSTKATDPDQDNRVPFDLHDLETWSIRLPTEQQWQRAAVGDTTHACPWGDQLDDSRGNYGGHIGRPTPVDRYPAGASPFGVLDLIGNLWEWCLNPWGLDDLDVSGYTYRVARGGAWNVSKPEYLRAADRGGSSPRGILNDGGFRIVRVNAADLKKAGS